MKRCLAEADARTRLAFRDPGRALSTVSVPFSAPSSSDSASSRVDTDNSDPDDSDPDDSESEEGVGRVFLDDFLPTVDTRLTAIAGCMPSASSSDLFSFISWTGSALSGERFLTISPILWAH